MQKMYFNKEYDYKRMHIIQTSFNNLSDLKDYLLQNPNVNSNVFLKQNSIICGEEIAGKPLSTAIEYCIGGYNKDIEIMRQLNKSLDKIVNRQTNHYRTIKSVTGSRPNVPNYIANNPKTMFKQIRQTNKKFINVLFNIACPNKTSENAILNRGALTLSLINLLEKQAYSVDFKVFMAAYCQNEVFYFTISLKRPSDVISLSKCFYPLCSKEFLRRIIFRVMESSPLKNKDWYPNYGVALTTEQTRTIFSIDKNDIVISSPDELGVAGYDILSDLNNFFKSLNINKEVVFNNSSRKEDNAFL